MVLATALFGKPAFRNLICNGLVLAEDGKKMSKSLKNYPSPMEVINDYGAVRTFEVHLLVWNFFYLQHQNACFAFLFELWVYGLDLISTYVICIIKTVKMLFVCWIGCLAIVPYQLSCCACWATSLQEGRSLWCCQYHLSVFYFQYLS